MGTKLVGGAESLDPAFTFFHFQPRSSTIVFTCLDDEFLTWPAGHDKNDQQQPDQI